MNYAKNKPKSPYITPNQIVGKNESPFPFVPSQSLWILVCSDTQKEAQRSTQKGPFSLVCIHTTIIPEWIMTFLSLGAHRDPGRHKLQTSCLGLRFTASHMRNGAS